VYDVRDPTMGNDGIVIIGGIVGELIVTFSALSDFILASPQNQNFMFTVDMLEGYLTDLLASDDSQFPDNAITVNLHKSVEDLGGDYESVAKRAREAANMADFGLQFLLEIQKDLILPADIIDVVYRVICKIAMMKQKEMLPIPEMTDEMTEE